jgi:ferrochelatase
MTKVAIILFNLGGPDTLHAVKPFLFNLFNDPAILRMPALPRYLLAKLISGLRNKKAQGIYERMGGGSPLLPNTRAQADSLDVALSAQGLNAKTFICMRYWHPMSAEVVQAVHDFAPDRIILLPLYPQFSTTTTQSSIDDWHSAWAKAGFPAVPTDSIGCYATDRDLIRAFAELTLPIINDAAPHGRPLILFSAHGLPQSVIDDGDPYQHQVEETAKHLKAELINRLGDTFDSIVCYQSKVGPKKWISPATDTVIEDAAKQKRPIVVVPVAFVSDHSETLVELDQDYRDLARQNGAPYYGRVPSLACHRLFIDALAARVQGAIRQDAVEKICKDGMICVCKTRTNT